MGVDLVDWTSTRITDTPSTAAAGLSDRIRGAHFNLYPPSTPPGAHASGGMAVPEPCRIVTRHIALPEG
jgi:hypothetical protein